MKARAAVILIVVAVAAVAFVVMRYPGAKGKAPAAPSPRPTAVKRAATPREAVTRYVESLYQKDFRSAYERLSARSREAHPYERFVKLAQSGEATDLDLAEATQGEEQNGRVVVSVPITEDPAEAAFTTVKEDGDWKVVFIGGAPWFPYPDEPAKTEGAGEG